MSSEPTYSDVARRGKNSLRHQGNAVVQSDNMSKQMNGHSRGMESKASRSQEPKAENATALAKNSVSIMLVWAFILALIFGGCCSNVYALEAIIKEESSSGILITFVQFLLVSFLTWPSNASLSNPPTFLKPRAVPLRRWIPNVILFFIVNMMNNFAFGFKISVPVHIILRSGGSVATLLVGWFCGKRYSFGQVIGVIMLTIGVVVAAMADAQAKGKLGTAATDDIDDFNLGLAILFVAQFLSAFMGVYVQDTYAMYGSHWRENLFYSHFLSLPLFSFFLPSLREQFLGLVDSPPVSIVMPRLSTWKGLLSKLQSLQLSTFMIGSKSKAGQIALITMPKNVWTLLINALTQYACIRGVNLLATRTSALGVTIVLNLRKLVSLFISIWLFGNTLPAGVTVGAVIVFSGAAVYAGAGTSKSKGRANAQNPKSKAL